MHIPDGYLGPQTYGAMYVVVAPLWVRALRRVRDGLPKRHLPLLALGAAFTFVVMMFNVPLPGGTTGHAVGSALLAIALGPWAALVAVSIALAIQALIFGDGGITSLAANIFTMAVVMPFAAHFIYRLIAGKSKDFGLRQQAGAFLAGYISVSLAAAVTAVLLGLQPIIATHNGRPLYAPYPISVALPAMLVGHLVLFGPIEGVVTALALKYLVKARQLDGVLIKTTPDRLQGEIQ